MTANDIIDYYLENSLSNQTSFQTHSLCPSIIESWLCLDVDRMIVISGQIHNHPHYTQGTHLKTSPIQGCFSNTGRVYVNTKNSMYELGMPHHNFVGDYQLILSDNEDIQTENLTFSRK